MDQLAILGKTLDYKDQVEIILEGLSEDYKFVDDQVEGRDTPPSLTELHERLLNHEAKLLSSIPSPAFPTTAHVAQQRSNNSNNRYQNRSQMRTNQISQSHQNNNRAYQCQPRLYLGRCQICSIQGHSARRYHQLQTITSSVNPASISHFTPWQPRANLAIGANYTANNWLLDSGANHHITNDLHNLSLHQPYEGGDDVLIGDGSPLSISHTGSIFLSSLTRNLALNKVLCVPNIHRNLISVYRLCNSNEVFVEFFPAHFQVKDLRTGCLFFKAEPRMSFTNGQ